METKLAYAFDLYDLDNRFWFVILKKKSVLIRLLNNDNNDKQQWKWKWHFGGVRVEARAEGHVRSARLVTGVDIVSSFVCVYAFNSIEDFQGEEDEEDFDTEEIFQELDVDGDGKITKSTYKHI